jgi:hypothetical protein
LWHPQVRVVSISCLCKTEATDVTELNKRERTALKVMDVCPYRFELNGKMPGVGPKTLERLVARSLAEAGQSPRQPAQPGWAITQAGKLALCGT